MYYTKIELKGYKRLQLNNINLIRIEPKHSIQLILGRNGSGKSSCLREITPLPSSHTQYEAGGHKILELTHRNHTYQVINRFDGKHSNYQLFKDGIDVFEGSTATDFRSLVKQEFGITNEIQSLIDGITRFSIMDVAKRRYWFTMLSKADYTFALQYYSKLRSRIRDLQGSLTITQNRYASELSKVMSDEEILKTREQLKLYQETLHKLLELKPRSLVNKSEAEQVITQSNKDIETICKKLNQIRESVSKKVSGPLSHVTLNIETCQKMIYKLQAKLEHEQNKESEIHERLKNLVELNDKDKVSKNLSETDLINQHRDLEESLETLSKGISNKLDLTINIGEFKSALDTIYNPLLEIISQIPLGYKDVTRKTKEMAVKNYQDNKLLLEQIQDKISKEQHQVSEMEYAKNNHKRICPNCQHQWYQGYEEALYRTSKANLERDVKIESEITLDLERTHGWVIEIDRVFDLRNRYGRIVTVWPTLKPLWDLLDIEGGLPPKKAQNVLESILRDVPTLFKIESLEKELKHTQELLELSRIKSDNDIEAQERLIDQTDKDLSRTQERIRNYNYELKNIKLILEHFEIIVGLTSELETLLSNKEQNIEYYKDGLKIDHFNRLITIFRQEVSYLEQNISKIDLQHNLLNQFKLQIKDHEEQIYLLKQAEEAMSPSTGLIAKGLTGFINWFISRMNYFVKQVWIYPLEILPISLTTELDLDYKFPVEIDQRFKAPDIKPGECNGSTCEIFDLAFRIVAMECLGLSDIPLQLDEFGSSFDHKHRNTAFQVVTGLTTSTNIPQIWMVSHHEQSYSSLRNVDTIVLDSENIVLPTDSIINGQTVIN